MCTRESSSYQAFSLNSTYIASISASQVSNFSRYLAISPTNPITITTTKAVPITITLLSVYQVLEIQIKTTKNLFYFVGRTGQEKPQITAVPVSSSDGSYEYLLNITSASVQQTGEISLTIVGSTAPFDIISFIFGVCIGKF